jgi:hypothetical protein
MPIACITAVLISSWADIRERNNKLDLLVTLISDQNEFQITFDTRTTRPPIRSLANCFSVCLRFLGFITAPGVQVVSFHSPCTICLSTCKHKHFRRRWYAGKHRHFRRRRYADMGLLIERWIEFNSGRHKHRYFNQLVSNLNVYTVCLFIFCVHVFVDIWSVASLYVSLSDKLKLFPYNKTN